MTDIQPHHHHQHAAHQEGYVRLDQPAYKPVGGSKPFLENRVLGILVRDYLIFLTSVFGITLLNIIFRTYLYNKSLELILEIQEAGRSHWWVTYYKFVEQVGTTNFVYIVLVFVYIFCCRALAFHYTLIISTMMFFLVFMKMVIRYPRPYQFHPDIIPLECSGQYGCPSATSIRAATMMTSIFLDLFHARRKIIHPIVYSIGLVVTSVMTISVLVCRVYFAAHAINQVIFGGVIGIEIALFLHFSVKPQVYRHLSLLSNTSPQRLNYQSFLLKATAFFALTQLIPFIAYWLLETYTTVNPLYLDNLYRKCPEENGAQVFGQRAFPYIGKTSLGYGAYIGILFQHRFLTSNTTNQTELWKSIARLLLCYMVVWVFLKQLELVTWSNGIWPLYFNKTIIPCGVAAFIFCALLDAIFEYMNLLNRDFSKKYCVYVHSDVLFSSEDQRTEGLISSNKNGDNKFALNM